MENWDKERLKLKLGLVIAAGLLALTYLLKNYAQRRQLLALKKVEASEERAIKRDQAQSRRERDERRRRTHPVLNLLEDRTAGGRSPFSWGNTEEAVFREIAQAPEASQEGAPEALRQALAEGQIPAAGPLWFMGRDPGIVDSLSTVLADPRRDNADRAKAAFVLSLTAEPAAFAQLREEYRKALKFQEEDYQVVLARSLFRERQDLAYQRFLESVAAREQTPDADDPPPSQLARQALKELGLAPNRP